MVTETEAGALRRAFNDLRWTLVRIIVGVVLVMAAMIVLVFRMDPSTGKDAPAVPLPPVSAPILPSPTTIVSPIPLPD
ncbi:hypothetical protein GFY24_33780 [Nocardia sp. SYP-A9097]|uniref:hypothetical protein n=1 Tax=Nocardia sp. SYP-A9097 TaxID=2663237 RepID=UPI00129BC238|nr:hypothetical protein [Nocardia sp. SYP-A9097]MRH92346.1 hypothetical protein [Nocardia sp. SYP-A9097]